MWRTQSGVWRVESCKVEWKVDLKLKRTVGRGKRASRGCDEVCKGFIEKPLGTGK